MDISESKGEAWFQFSFDDKPESESKEFAGLLHLFEHRYKENVCFWYGMAQVELTFDQYLEIRQLGSPKTFCIGVRLQDGRLGAARHLYAKLEDDGQSSHIEIALIGWTALAIP